MKKNIKLLAIFAALAAVVLAVGCSCKRDDIPPTGKFGEASNGIYLYRDLAIQDVEIQDFDTQKYNVEEYRDQYLRIAVDTYNTKHSFNPGDPEKRAAHEPSYEKPITVIRCELKGGNLYQELLYANAGDFTAFRGDELKEKGGSALKAGFLSAAGSDILKLSFQSPSGETVDVASLAVAENAGDYRFLVADFEALLYGDGEIIAFSKGAVYDAENNLVKSKNGEPVVVIFK